MTLLRKYTRENFSRAGGAATLKALVYRNTASPVPGWELVHERQARGYGYVSGQRFVHVYGRDVGLWNISNGLTVTVGREGNLRDWVVQSFGAQDIEESNLEVGETIEGVWRPGIFYDDEMLQGLGENGLNRRLSEQTLLLLIQRLDELLLFVEPSAEALTTYGHKARELLILACTEVEAQWRHHLVRGGVVAGGQGFTTNDYVRLRNPLFLAEYQVALPRHAEVPDIRPFQDWTPAQPTQSLSWYDAYNKAKHDRQGQFSAATVLSCIQAVAANIVLFAVRFGPFRLYNGGGMLSALFNPMFELALIGCDPKTFYVPDLDVAGRNDALTWGNAEVLPWQPGPFRL